MEPLFFPTIFWQPHMIQHGALENPTQDTTCLSMTSACSSADARVGCLMNKDSAGPCVWCGGAACNDQSQAVCESFGLWKAGGSMAVVRSRKWLEAEFWSQEPLASSELIWMFEHPLLVCYSCYHCGPQMTRPRSGAGVGDTEVAQCEAGKPAVVKVKHESWQAGIELVVFDLVAVSAEIDMVLVGIFQDVLRLPQKRLERKWGDLRSRTEWMQCDQRWTH